MKYLSLTLIALFAAGAQAQSVTVGLSGADYPTLSAAIAATSASATQPDVITFIDEGPFIEPGRIIINQSYAMDVIDPTPTDLTIQAAPGLRPRVVVPGGNASAIYLRKVGSVTLRDIVLMPATTGTPAQHGIVVDDEGGRETVVTLENILITSNDGANQPVASLDGLTSPTYTANTVTFRQDGINCSSMDPTVVEKIYINDVVISGIPGSPTANSCGIRGFCDGAPGSEWIVGPGCVISYLNTTKAPVDMTNLGAGAFQPGDNRDMALTIRGTQEKPVLVFNNNLNAIAITNGAATTTDGLGDVEWAILANNTGRAYLSGDISGTSHFKNVTFINHNGMFQPGASADENVITFENVIAAGNGDNEDPMNAFHFIATGNPGFTSNFTADHSAIVQAGPFTLNTNLYGGTSIFSDSNWNVTTTNIINSDPAFVSTDPLQGGFAVVSNPAYGTAGPGGVPLIGGGAFAASSVSDWQIF